MGCGSSKDVKKPSATGAPDVRQESTTISRMGQYVIEGAGETLRFSCWDFGGQDTFYGLHHFYMGRNSVYVLMFNMEWFLAESESDWPKHLDFLAFWLNSIAAHAADPKDHSMAPIILVGSHKDRVSSPKQHEHISKLLCDTFQSMPAWSRGVQRKDSLCFFPVDNTRGSKDPVIAEIKKTVQEVVKKEKYIKEQIPFAWLKVLERVQEKDRPSCLTFDEVVKICQECGMPSTPGASVEDEALVMLKVFNDLGQLMHHSEPTLRHLVILDPANYLVEPASRIICQHDMHENLNEFLQNARKEEDKLLTKLQEKGILDPKLLDIVWEDRLKDKQDLLTLLVKFGFFVPLLRPAGEATDTKESTGNKYLVPAILPTSLVRHPSTDTPKLVGYLFFALKKQMEEMRRKGYVTVDDVKRDGFFPMGLGPAATGEIVSECQCLHDMTLDDMRLSSTEISAAFGRHEFILRTRMDLKMMEIVIMVDSSLLITELILDLVKTAAEKMVPNIEFALAVDLDSGGVCQNGAVDKPRGSLVIISGQGGLQDKLTVAGTHAIPVGPGKTCTSVEAQTHFEKWIPPKGLREQGYDCFISYRWTASTSGGMDTKLVDGIYKKICPDVIGAEKRQIHVFLDRHRLEAGRRFDKDFAKALLKSTLVIPIVSCAALQKMLSLNEESDIDNVLVEWVIICELQDIGDLDSCLPVMLGNVFETPQKDGKFTSNIFDEGIVAKLPEVVVSKVVSFVQEVFITAKIKPSEKLHTRTVKGTVETIMKAMGVLTWDIASNPIRGANGDDSMMHAHAEWTRNLFSTVASKAIECLEKEEALGKSKVTQMSASTQVDRDLKALFESHGLAELREKVCDALGAKCVQDIAMADDGDIETLTWLKPIERKKLKKLIADSKTGDSTKEEIPVISSISSRKEKSGDHNDKSSMSLAVNNEIDDKNVHEKHFEKETGIGDTEKDTKGGRDKDVSENRKKWESMSPERVEECLREAMRRGSKPLNTSRLNIVGEGRAGKTAWLRAVSNKAFKDTASTIGVNQTLLEVNKVDMETKCEGAWSVVEEGTLIMTADEAVTRLAAEIAITEPQAYVAGRDSLDVESQRHDASAQGWDAVARQRRSAPAELYALVEARDRDREELAANLQVAAESNNQHVVLQTATGAKVMPAGDKYLQARLLEYGPSQKSSLGLVNFMGVDKASFYSRLSLGVDAMEIEVKDRSQVEEQRADIENDRRELENLVAEGKHTLAKTKEKEIEEKTKETDELEEMLVKAERVFLHILNEEAGSCNETFQNGWKMDCDPDTGEVWPERLVDDGKGGKRGMRAVDFWEDPKSVACGHTLEEVISGRFYTTFGWKPINIPLRDPKRKDKKGKIFKPVLYPVITYHLNDFIKKCRTLEATSHRKNVALDLYRGMSNACLQDGFMQEGGSELAPMSTTANLAIALKYSAYSAQKSVLLRIRTTNFMDRGPAFQWISAFPHEAEHVYPPITFLKPKYDTPEIFKIGDVEYEVVDVTAQMP